jgi:hypothetical protein
MAESTRGENITRIDLITDNHNNAFLTYRPNPVSDTAVWELQLSPNGIPYFYAQVTTADGARSWSSPIFLTDGGRLRTDPSWLAFSASAVGQSPIPQSMQLYRRDGFSTSWAVDSKPDWVSVHPDSGNTLPVTLEVAVDAAGLSAGLYDDVVRFRNNERPDDLWLTGVSLALDSVLPRRKLTLEPYRVSMSISETASSTTPIIHIAAGTGLHWEAVSDVPWLRVSSSHGTGPADLPLDCDIGALRPGHHSGHVNIVGGANLQTASVDLTVVPDPLITLTLQQGADGYSDTTDTYIHLWHPSSNYGGSASLKLRDVVAALVRFELPPIPSQARIWSATLKLYPTWRSSNRTMDIVGYNILRPWVAGQADWTQAATGIPWSEPGADGPLEDREDIVKVEHSFSSARDWIEIDVATIVRDWATSPANNQGLVLLTSSSGVEYNFASADYASQSLRPILQFAYYIPKPLPTTTVTASPTCSPTATMSPTVTSTPSSTPSTTPTGTSTSTPTGTAQRCYLPVIRKPS